MEHSFHVYCGYQGTSEPRTYLILENTSSNPDLPGYNYSSYSADPARFYGKTFQQLRVAPWKDLTTGQIFLEVIGVQGEYWEYSPADDAILALLKGVGVLTARASLGGTASANLNLEGTAFHIAEGLSFGEQGNVNGYDYQVEISSDRKNLGFTLAPNSKFDLSADQGGATVLPVGHILLEHD